jgi:hypothetical protein
LRLAPTLKQSILITMISPAASSHRPYLANKTATSLVMRACAATLALSLTATVALADSIAIPNYSFELQSAAGLPPQSQGTNPFIDNWAKDAEPQGYTPPFPQLVWFATAGVFLGAGPGTYSPNPYVNITGVQAGYILAYPGVKLFQDAAVSPTFSSTFEVGKEYTFTLGVFGKPQLGLSPTSAFRLSLYYRDTTNTLNDPLGQRTIINSTTINYGDGSAFVDNATPSLIDYSVSVGEVLSEQAWAGKNIGLMMESVDPNATFGNWDFDNARLTSNAVPEPTSIALLALGLSALGLRRSRKG